MSIAAESTWAAAPNTTRGQPSRLSSDRTGQRIAYASNKSIFVRSIDDPAHSIQYTQHTARTTVARFSPSGFLIASGDANGTVRVWEALPGTPTKGEYSIVAGPIHDLAWDADSQRIIAVGDGKQRFGHCFTADSGNSVGEISGHSSQINCVSIRQQRPLRAATGGDDKALCFFHGAPFKFNTSLRANHENVIYDVQFSPDGEFLLSVGADRKIWLYDGKTCQTMRQIGQDEHKGSIFAVCWAEDSKRFVTCSADQTVKTWDVETGECKQTWRLGDGTSASYLHQQVGVTWPRGRNDDLIISLDLQGDLNYLYPQQQVPTRIITGHQKSITASAVDTEHSLLWTGAADGVVHLWDLSSGLATRIGGSKHSNYVSGIAIDKSENVIRTVAWDDTLRCIATSNKTYVKESESLSAQPLDLAMATTQSHSSALIATGAGLMIRGRDKTLTKHDAIATHCCVTTSKALAAIGGTDGKVRFLDTTISSSLQPIPPLTVAASAISALAFSSNGTRLAAGLANGKILVFTFTAAGWKLETDRWSAHTTRVTSIAWREDDQYAASSSLDTNLHVWSLANPGKRVRIAGAHKEGVSRVVWVGGSKLASMGADAAVKLWRVDIAE